MRVTRCPLLSRDWAELSPVAVSAAWPIGRGLKFGGGEGEGVSPPMEELHVGMLL